MISIIVSIAEDLAIGFQNRLVFRISADMKRFKSLTVGNTVLMGRKTFESLPKGALPDRRNIVLTRDSSLTFPGADSYQSIQDALATCAPDDHVYVIGGAEIYRQALPLADELEVTLVHAVPEQADTYFPDFLSSGDWETVSREDFGPDEKNIHPYSFITYRRKSL